MTRVDRTLVEDLFADKHIQVRAGKEQAIEDPKCQKLFPMFTPGTSLFLAQASQVQRVVVDTVNTTSCHLSQFFTYCMREDE